MLHTRQAGHLVAVRPQSPCRSHPQNSTQQGSAHRLSTDSFDPQPSFGNWITPDTRRGRRSRRHQSPGIPRANLLSDKTSASTVVSDHVHWCTICEQPRQYETCDGYKRHEKEHETRFICMPSGAVEYKNGSSHCTLCGVLNPTQHHLQGHQLGSCTQNTRSFPRKSLLVNHLKNHGIKAGEPLAERWRRPTEKKAFACGFCVQSFSTMVDRLNHIDAHYKSRQHIDDWDANKVIEGLLRQPELNEAWRHIVSSNAYIASSGFTWDQRVVKGLQVRLEMGVEDPYTLAMAALELSTPYRQSQNRMILVTGHVDQDMDFGQTFNHYPHHDTVSSSYDPASTIESTQQGQPCSAFQESSNDFDDFSNSRFSNVRHQPGLSLNVPDADRDGRMEDYLWSGSRPSPSLEASTCPNHHQPSLTQSLGSTSVTSGGYHTLESTQSPLHTKIDCHAGSSHGNNNGPPSTTFGGFPSHPFIPRSVSYGPPDMQVAPSAIEEPEKPFDPFIGPSAHINSPCSFAQAKERSSRRKYKGSSAHDLAVMNVEDDDTEYATHKHEHKRHARRRYNRLEGSDVSSRIHVPR